MRLATIFLLAVSALAQTGASRPAGQKFDKARFESTLRYYDFLPADVDIKIADPKPSKDLPGFSEIDVKLMYNGESRDQSYYLSSDGQVVIPGAPGSVAAFNINGDPFKLNLDKLSAANSPSFGPANAPVTIFEFGDFECPSCRAEAPVLRTLLPMFEGDKVRVVFKNFPLESLHPWARAAAGAASCVYRQNADAFWKVYDWFYETQDEITPSNLNDKVLGWAGKNGIDSVQLGRCIDAKASDADVANNIAEGRALNVNGTPTLFVNGRKINGVEWQALQQIIDMALERSAKPR